LNRTEKWDGWNVMEWNGMEPFHSIPPGLETEHILREAKRGEKIYSIPKQRTAAIYTYDIYTYSIPFHFTYGRNIWQNVRHQISRRRLLTCFPFPVSRLVDRGHPRVYVDSISCTHANFRLLCPEKHARNQTSIV
jgi:hypothetical protein